jgi:hypothetical protein
LPERIDMDQYAVQYQYAEGLKVLPETGGFPISLVIAALVILVGLGIAARYMFQR